MVMWRSLTPGMLPLDRPRRAALAESANMESRDASGSSHLLSQEVFITIDIRLYIFVVQRTLYVCQVHNNLCRISWNYDPAIIIYNKPRSSTYLATQRSDNQIITTPSSTILLP